MVLLVAPTVWEHYLLFALPALGIAIYGVAREGDAVCWDWVLAIAAFFYTMKLTRFYSDSPFGQFMSGSQTIGMILLWIWLVRYKLRLSGTCLLARDGS